MTPPIVVYHGTDGLTASIIAASGMLPSSKAGMLGPGIYFAKWEKARDFGLEDAERVKRNERGCVVRVILTAATCKEMTVADVCTCGCARAFVDHNVHHGASFNMTFVPDNSLPATRRAEWCVRTPDIVVVDGIFKL